jgi:hypothetical protein
MLIRLSGDAEQSNESDQYPTPIVGSAMHAYTPTSADVHLYADPELFEGRTPLLYADCEGFDGGEKLPIGAVEHRTAATDGDFTFTRLSPGRTRSLKWADRDERRTRSYAVKKLYPRILYTFSDVVVFVLRDSKSVSSSLHRKLLTTLQNFRGNHTPSVARVGQSISGNISQSANSSACHYSSQ